MARRKRPEAHMIKKKAPSERHKEKGVVVIKKSTLKNVGIVAAVIVVIAAVLFAASKIPSTPTSSGDKAKLEFYVMSQCPYGTQVENAIQPVLAEMGDAVDFQLDFILYARENYAGREAQYCIEELCSMHGTNEVKGDIVQLCALEYNPESYMDMVVCMNQNSAQIPNNWEQCAEQLDMDVAKIKSCYEGDEGLDLLRASAARADARGATGSPTIYLNDGAYTGNRDEL
ncbi:GILT family protein, partial [Candidatus Woesearchaeota archaeon]|nr:GILT family protein [Candidatus Woesearchaeota archaeon]